MNRLFFLVGDILECFLVKGRPVSNTAKERSRVDKIEALFAVQPWLGEIVDLESEIGRNHRGLGRAEIGSQDLDEWIRAELAHSLNTAYGPRMMDICRQSHCWLCVSLWRQRRAKCKRLTLPRFLAG